MVPGKTCMENMYEKHVRKNMKKVSAVLLTDETG
jgi:hypothetical protein